MRGARGVTVLEAVIALSILVVGALLVTEALAGSQGATLSDVAKTRTVRESDRLLRQIALELAQTTTNVDPALPAEESRRCWTLPNGVRFQKVEGYDFDIFGGATQRWSAPITYRWEPSTQRITREVEGLPSAVVAQGIRSFAVASTLDGPLAVTVEAASGTGSRGTEATHRRTVRITPRNALR